SAQRHAYDARIDKLAEQFAGDGRAAFLGIEEPAAFGKREATAELAAAAIPPAFDPQRSFPTLLDDRGTVALRYSADAFPMVVVIDARGLVRYRGPIDDNADPAFVTRSFASDVLLDLLEERPTATLAARH